MSSVTIDSDCEEPFEAAKSDLDAETELGKIDEEISDITKKIRQYEQRRRVLKLKAEKLREKIQQKECNALLEQDWERRRFSWSEELDKANVWSRLSANYANRGREEPHLPAARGFESRSDPGGVPAPESDGGPGDVPHQAGGGGPDAHLNQ